MFDLGWNELLIVLVIAILVIGPKDIPKAMHTVGKWMGAVRKVARDFQRHVDDAMKEAELDELKKGIGQARRLSVKGQLEKAIDPDGKLRNFKIDAEDDAKTAPSKQPAAAQADGEAAADEADAAAARPVEQSAEPVEAAKEAEPIAEKKDEQPARAGSAS